MPRGSKFFHKRVNPFTEGCWCSETRTRNQKSCLRNGNKIYPLLQIRHFFFFQPKSTDIFIISP